MNVFFETFFSFDLSPLDFFDFFVYLFTKTPIGWDYKTMAIGVIGLP